MVGPAVEEAAVYESADERAARVDDPERDAVAAGELEGDRGAGLWAATDGREDLVDVHRGDGCALHLQPLADREGRAASGEHGENEQERGGARQRARF